MDLKAIAQGTLAALDRGAYIGPDTQEVAIASLVEACIKGTRFFEPDMLNAIRDTVLAQAQRFASMSIQLVNETTLQCTRRLSQTEEYGRICALNFASARNPGGGFLGGARAQEESLARSSGLYPSLTHCFEEFYAFHRNERSALYSDRMIYSYQCPIFRDDAGHWLAQPYTIDVITSAAPNAGAIMQNEPSQSKYIIPVFAERARKVLALASHVQCDTLVLGLSLIHI